MHVCIKHDVFDSKLDVCVTNFVHDYDDCDYGADDNGYDADEVNGE